MALIVPKPGPQGPAGPQGPQGSQGPAGAGADTYTHQQLIPATVWTIVHNLGKYPSVTVIDSAGTEVEGDVQFTDTNTIVITFSSAFAGKASLN